MFTKYFLTAVAACSLLVSSVNAHMVIREPVPYGKSSLNNSPLEPDGSDFPCKQRSGVYDVTEMNNMPVGVPQNLAFTGGATHGGGSCQVSVTLDKEPTKDSSWKVIQSIIGGCPSNHTDNLSGNPNGENAAVFQFSIPQGMPNGEYTLAWTWFNKIGNREMYMNCAPIKVSGGADNNDVLDTLPDMFVANIGAVGNECGTAEGQDFVFPNCGKYAETVMQTALGSSTTGDCAAPTGGSSSGSGSSGSPSSAPAGYSTPAASSPAAPTGYGSGSSAEPAAPSYGSGSGVAPTAPSYGGNTDSAPSSVAPKAPAPTGYGSGASSIEAGAAAGGVATTYRVVTQTAIRTISADGPAPSSYAAPAQSAAAPSGSSPAGYGTNKSTPAAGNGTSSSSGTVPCATDGEVICMSGGKFGICDHGLAFPMMLSAGTSCSGGVISKRHNLSRHLRQHLRSHAHKF